MGYKRFLFGRNTTPKKQAAAVQFFFCVSGPGGDVTLSDCCAAIDSRIRQNVLRLRFMYEFLLKGLVFPSPFPFDTVPTPSNVVNEAMFALQMRKLDVGVGMFIVNELWQQPGVHGDELLARAQGDGIAVEDFNAAMQLLWSRYLISDNQGLYWYVTGRNPARQVEDAMANRLATTVRPGNVYWSRLF